MVYNRIENQIIKDRTKRKKEVKVYISEYLTIGQLGHRKSRKRVVSELFTSCSHSANTS